VVNFWLEGFDHFLFFLRWRGKAGVVEIVYLGDFGKDGNTYVRVTLYFLNGEQSRRHLIINGRNKYTQRPALDSSCV
jgi:hypothetical protein